MSGRKSFARLEKARRRRNDLVARSANSNLVPACIESLETRTVLTPVLPGLDDHGVVIGNAQVAGQSSLLVDSAYNPQLSFNFNGSGLFINLDNSAGQINSLRSVVLRDIVVDNNANAGIQINLSNITLDRLAINRALVTNNGGAGVVFNLNNATIGELVIWDGNYPNLFPNTDNTQSRYINNASDGIFLQGQNSNFGNLFVQGNLVEGNDRHGVNFNLNSAGVTNFSLNDNLLRNNQGGSGINFETNRANLNGSVFKNTITGNTSHGMSFLAQSLETGSTPTSSPSNFRFNTFADNELRNNGGSGLSAELREKTTWAGTLLRNNFSNNGLRGIDFQALDTENAFDLVIGAATVNAQGSLIDGNQITGNTGAAIFLALNDSSGNTSNTTGRFRIVGNIISGTLNDATSTIFNGEGINIRATGDVTRQNGAARYFSSVIDRNTIGTNAGDGIRFNIAEDSELIDLTIGNLTGPNLTFDVNGATPGGGNIVPVQGNGNVIQNNGGNGISIIRRDSSIVENIRILDNRVTGNTEGIYLQASNTYQTVPNAARPNLRVVSGFSLQHNDLSNNRLNGVHLRTEFNAVLLADLYYNRIDSNALNGIRVTGLENNATDFENVGGLWIKNAITSNGTAAARAALGFAALPPDDENGNGIRIENVVGSVNPLVIGRDGFDTDSQSLGNYIAFNGSDGIEIGARAGSGGTNVPVDIRDGLDVVNNLIISNGQNGIGNPLFAGKGIDIEVLSGQPREFRIDRNVIQGNAGDGIEISNTSGILRLTAVGNFIDLNGGRGVDLLNRPVAIGFSAEAFVLFGRDGSTTVGGVALTNRNTVTRNGLEGVYVVNTAAPTQQQNVDSQAPLEFVTITGRGNATGRVNLVLDIENNEIRDNGLGVPVLNSPASELSGTGLVLRVGSQNSASGLFTAPDLDGDDSATLTTAAAGVGSNIIQGTGSVGSSSTSGNGRVNARIVNNEFSGNGGDDVLIEGFVSLFPRTTNGNWDATNFAQGTNVYDRDPLSRLNLVFFGNTGDSLDVVRTSSSNDSQTVSYDNDENVFKSRNNKTAPNPSGPFGSGSRSRLVTRVASEATFPGTPGSAGSFWYDGTGASTLRIEDNFSVDGFTANQLGDTFNTLSGEPGAESGLTGLGSFVAWDQVTAGTFSFLTASIGDAVVNEADGTVTLTVKLSELAQQNVFITYQTSDGSAKVDPNNDGDPSDGDYVATSGTLTFLAGTDEATITVTIIDDSTFDNIEQFYVDLLSITNGALLDSRAVVTILPDDDPLPAVTIGNIVVDEASGVATFVVSLSSASSSVVTVDFATIAGTAKGGGVDFSDRTGSVSISPGNTSATVSISVTPDSIDETDETFQLRISNAINATIAGGQAVATAIINDTRYFSVSDVTVSEGGTATVTVTLNEPLAAGATAFVTVTTENGNALAGSDYTSNTDTLVFTGSTTSLTFTVDTTADLIKEGDEYFLVRLTGATGAAIAKATGRITIADPWEAEGANVGHLIGRVDGDGWSANTAQDDASFLLFGPYTTVVPAGPQVAKFRLLVDNNTFDNAKVVRIDVWDSTAGVMLAQRDINRRDFTTANQYQDFDLSFINNTAGNSLEFRVFWYDTSYVKVDNVRVSTAPVAPLVLQAETDLLHLVGRFDGDGWSANTALDNAGYLAYGPYTKDIPAGPQSATFRLLVDNNTFDNSRIVTIDVFDASVGRVIAQRVILRSEFSVRNEYQDFVLEFNNSFDSNLEFRVFWHDTSYVKLDRVIVSKTPTPVLRKFEAESHAFHAIGRQTGDGWSANTVQDNAGYLSYGPYTTAIPAGTHVALYRLLVDNVVAANSPIVTIDVVDQSNPAQPRVLAQRTINRAEFESAYDYQNFTLQFTNSAGANLEFRVFWHDTSFVQLDHIAVLDTPAPQRLIETESSQVGHLVGRAAGRGWSANTAQDSAGYLATGPYGVSALPAGGYTANFRLLVDNNTFDNSPIVTIDVFNRTNGQLLAQRTINRLEFAGALAYQNFALSFITPAGADLEFRTFWHATSYVEQDYVRVLPLNYSASAELEPVFQDIDELLLIS